MGDTPADDKQFTQADIDRIVADRLKRETAKYSDYAELKAKAEKLDKAQQDAKSAEDKAAEKVAAAEKRIADVEKKVEEADARALRATVASAKGLTPAMAKRLSGATQEELEADADEMLEAFGKSDDGEGGDTGGGAKPKPVTRPKPDLKGGGDATEEPDETDPRKLAESIPRM